MSDSLRPHGLQHTRLRLPLSPGVCSNSRPMSPWCCLTISSSVTPFSFCPQIFSSIRVFSNESALCIRWPKYWSFNISYSNEYSRLTSFRIDQFDFFVVQGTLKSLLQHHNPNASVLQHSAFFMGQHSQVYMTIGKNSSFDYRTLVSKLTSLLFNILSRFVIDFLPRGKCLLIRNK